MVKICCPREKPMNDGLWTDGHNRSTYTQSDQWAVATKWLACCHTFIISSSRHHKQLQHRTGCPEGLRKGVSYCTSLIPRPLQLVWEWDYHHTRLRACPMYTTGLSAHVYSMTKKMLWIKWDIIVAMTYLLNYTIIEQKRTKLLSLEQLV